MVTDRICDYDSIFIGRFREASRFLTFAMFKPLRRCSILRCANRFSLEPLARKFVVLC